MGFFKNLIVLNEVSGRGTCGMVKLVLNGDVLKVQASALFKDAAAGEYYLAVTDVDGSILDFSLGKAGRISKTIEMRNQFNAAKRMCCCIARVSRGVCEIAALGGTNGEARFPCIFTEYFKTRAYYLPPVHSIPSGIQIVDMIQDKPISPETPPAKAAENAVFTPACEEMQREELVRQAAVAAVSEDAILREDTTISDLLQKESEVVACENYYDADYEKRLRLREAARYFHPFSSTAPDYEEFCLRNRRQMNGEIPREAPAAAATQSVAEKEVFAGEPAKVAEEKPAERQERKENENAAPEAERKKAAEAIPGGLTRADKVDAIEKLLEHAERGAGEGEEEAATKSAAFYDTVESQLNKLFNEYGAEEYLERLITDSRWARVEYGNGGDFYTVGIIYSGSHPAYICYGIPGDYSEIPPRELDGFCEWLPRDMENPRSKGYWMMYQDAETGESVNVGMR